MNYEAICPKGFKMFTSSLKIDKYSFPTLEMKWYLPSLQTQGLEVEVNI